LASGAEVAAIVRDPSAAPRLKEIAARVKIVRGDLEDVASLREELTAWRPEACVHTAWYAEPGMYLDSTKSLNGLRFSLELLEDLAAIGCAHVVMTGTCFEYDTDARYLSEDTPTHPRTLYAACKLALNLVAAQRAAQLGVGFAWARIFYVYGPFEDRRRLVPARTLSLLRGERFAATTGEQVRDYMHVDDVASGLASLARARCQGVYNVCSAEPTTMASLMHQIGRLVGREDLIDFGARQAGAFEPDFICGENRRLREATGWSPRRSLSDGLASAVEWWQSQSAPAR